MFSFTRFRGENYRKVADLVFEKEKAQPVYLYPDMDPSEVEDEDFTSQIELNEGGRVQQVPNTVTRDVIYISGAAGSGKSYYAGKYLEQFRKTFPKAPIFLFTTVPKDEALDKIPLLERLILNDELKTDPPDVKDFPTGCLVMFDDIDVMVDEELADMVRHIRDELLEIGRHRHIYVVCTSHALFGNKKTKVLLLEATSVTLFLRSGNTYSSKRFFKEYCGFETKTVKKIQNIPSRWVTLYKNYPSYVMYEHGIITTHELAKD